MNFMGGIGGSKISAQAKDEIPEPMDGYMEWEEMEQACILIA